MCNLRENYDFLYVLESQVYIAIKRKPCHQKDLLVREVDTIKLSNTLIITYVTFLGEVLNTDGIYFTWKYKKNFCNSYLYLRKILKTVDKKVQYYPNIICIFVFA